MFYNVNMMEDEYVRSYIGRILEIIPGTKTYGGTKEEDVVVWNILNTLTPTFRQVAQMIQLLIPCTKEFTREMLLRRLEEVEVGLRQLGDLIRVDTTFSALNV